jgi:hypothetical protein
MGKFRKILCFTVKRKMTVLIWRVKKIAKLKRLPTFADLQYIILILADMNGVYAFTYKIK